MHLLCEICWVPLLKTPDSLRIVAGDVLYKRELLEPFMNLTKDLLSFSQSAK